MGHTPQNREQTPVSCIQTRIAIGDRVRVRDHCDDELARLARQLYHDSVGTVTDVYGSGGRCGVQVAFADGVTSTFLLDHLEQAR